MVEITIESIDSLIEEIRKLKNIYGTQSIWYRGQEDKEWHLEPSIHRGKLFEKENYVSNDFYIYVKYSLQGTTQGRYLTGGVPPVRFSM